MLQKLCLNSILCLFVSQVTQTTHLTDQPELTVLDMSSYKQLLCEFLLFLQPLIYLSTPTHLGRSQAVLHLTWRALSLSRGQRSKHTHCADFTKAQDQLLPVISCYLWMPAQLTSRSHRGTSDLKEVLKDKKKKINQNEKGKYTFDRHVSSPALTSAPAWSRFSPSRGKGHPHSSARSPGRQR